MRTRLVAAIAAAFLLSPLGAFAETGEAGTNIQFLGGLKMLHDNDWKPAEDETAFGVQFDVQPENWDFSFAVGLIAAQSPSEETDVAGIGKVTSESRTTEMNVGIRKYIIKEDLRPFIGVGLSLIRAELETTSPAGSDSDSGTGVGPWIGLGLIYMVSDWLGVGGQLQYTSAEAEIFGNDLDAGGIHADALLHFSF